MIMKTHEEVRSLITELLGQLGSSREAREYLRRFSSVGSLQFAVIKVGGKILQDQLDELASALHFLFQAGLYPIVLHGAGPQLDQSIAAEGIPIEKIDGLRVTTPQVMQIARQVIYQQNLRLVNALERRGARTRSIQHGVFDCVQTDRKQLGLVGEIRRVNLTPIRSAIESHALPVVTCLGESPAGQVLNVNADYAVNSLVKELQPFKVIFLTETGGLLNQQGRILSGINLVTDFERLQESDWVHSGMRVKIQQIKEILDALPESASVSITSASNLTKELFTHSGAGTLVRRGERFLSYTEIDSESLAVFQNLVEGCFDRQLVDGWFHSLKTPTLILSQSGRAAALITAGTGGINYLDKFAVTPPAQGEGLASALWKQLRDRYPTLYWRSRTSNPINAWYHRQADFSWRSEPWIVFGYGLSELESASACIRDALSRPSSWIPLPNPDKSLQEQIPS